MKYAERVVALRIELHKKKLDAFITSYQPNIRYLTGFTGSNGFVVITQSSVLFLTDFRYEEQIQTEVVADKKNIGKGSLVKLAASQKIFSQCNAIGYEKDHLSVSEYLSIEKSVDKKKLQETIGIVETLRDRKDETEIGLIKKAVEISDSVFKKILSFIKPGISELEVSAEISYFHKKIGAEKDAFDIIVASGKRGSLPHGRASEKKIGKNEFITLDFGCIYNGYHSDMTRTIAMGKPDAEMKKVYQIVLDAQRKAIDAIQIDVSTKRVDTIARNHISHSGYGKYFGHSLGHGVGLEIHEQLRLSQSYNKKLKTGNVITIEPGIYLPQKFGVRIEDIIVVRKQGAEILTSSPKELIVL